MSDWKTEMESKHDIEMFLCGQESDLSENDKTIILELIEMLTNDEPESLPDAPNPFEKETTIFG